MRLGTPCDPDCATPLRVTAHLAGPLKMPPEGYVALDALLAAVVARVEQAPPPTDVSQFVPIDIPVVRHKDGYHLASFSVAEPEAYETTWQNRRFPVEEAQAMGDAKLKRITTVGRTKPFRAPRQLVHLRGDRLDWYCTGDAGRIRDLLSHVRYVGGCRGQGKGRVSRWTVEPVAPSDVWEGFPVALDGYALRRLPASAAGVDGAYTVGRLTYPYWSPEGHTECIDPVPA